MTSQYPERTPPDLSLFSWAVGILVVGLTIVAIISLINALIHGPIERKTDTGPSTTQSA